MPGRGSLGRVWEGFVKRRQPNARQRPPHHPAWADGGPISIVLTTLVAIVIIFVVCKSLPAVTMWLSRAMRPPAPTAQPGR